MAGGSTGHGALLHGGLSEDGAVLGLRVVTARKRTPRVLELRGRDVFPVVHAYGTNGIIVAVEVPLARAQPVDRRDGVLPSEPSLAEAAAFALDVGTRPPSVPCSRAPPLQAPLAFKFLDKEPSIMHADRPSTAADHVALVQCAAAGVGPIRRLAADNSGRSNEGDADRWRRRCARAADYEFGWNHTTLHCAQGQKYDVPAVRPRAGRRWNWCRRSRTSLIHLGVAAAPRGGRFGGKVGFASLALAVAIFPCGAAPRDHGVARGERHAHLQPAHRGARGRGHEADGLRAARLQARVDPGGVLNPGKMRAWDEQRATTEEAAAADPRGSFAASGPADTSSLQDDDVASPPRIARYWAEWKTTDFASTDLSEAVAVLPLAATRRTGRTCRWASTRCTTRLCSIAR